MEVIWRRHRPLPPPPPPLPHLAALVHFFEQLRASSLNDAVMRRTLYIWKFSFLHTNRERVVQGVENAGRHGQLCSRQHRRRTTNDTSCIRTPPGLTDHALRAEARRKPACAAPSSSPRHERLHRQRSPQLPLRAHPCSEHTPTSGIINQESAAHEPLQWRPSTSVPPLA